MAGHEAAFKATAAAQGRHDGREVAVGLEDDGGIGLFQRLGQALFVPDTGDDAQGLVAFAQNGAGTRGRRLERGDARYDLHRQGIIQLPERFQQIAERAVDQRVADGQEGRVLAAPQHVAPLFPRPRARWPCRASWGIPAVAGARPAADGDGPSPAPANSRCAARPPPGSRPPGARPPRHAGSADRERRGPHPQRTGFLSWSSRIVAGSCPVTDCFLLPSAGKTRLAAVT